MTDEDQFETLLRALFETFGQTPTAGQILGYRMAMDDVPIEDLERGVRRAMRDSKFLPKPVELRELAGVISLSARAALAWSAAKKAVHSIGSYGSVDFEDPTINAVIRNMGGWKEFCGRDADTFETFTRKDFERIYQLFAAGQVGEMGRYLTGIHNEPQPRRRFPVGYDVPRAPRQLDGGVTVDFIAALAEAKGA